MDNGQAMESRAIKVTAGQANNEITDRRFADIAEGLSHLEQAISELRNRLDMVLLPGKNEVEQETEKKPMGSRWGNALESHNRSLYRLRLQVTDMLERLDL